MPIVSTQAVGETCTISLAEQTAGLVLFPATLNQQDMDTLDVGIRFFMNEATTEDSLASYRYPLFESSSITLSGAIDPCSFEKCYFSLDQAQLTSWYRTPLGQQIMITPEKGAQLVFAIKPSSKTPSDTDHLYLVPKGAFSLAKQNSGELMCGLSSVEYVDTENEQQMLHFVHGKPAYAPGFTSGAVENSRLTNIATTSWAYIKSSKASYYAQPQDSILFGNAEHLEFLRPLKIPGTSLPVITDRELFAHCYPMVPYAGISNATVDVSRYEFNVLALERKRRIDAISQRVNSK